MKFVEAPNLRHLRMIQVIGKVGGVSGASRVLSASQPAVTQAVANLEADLGSPIFERCATGTYPTPLGHRYLLRIDRFFDILDDAIAKVLRADSGADQPEPRVDRLLTSTQLRSLIVTCETGHVDEIAKGLGVTTASLFRSARTIERVLGKQLFDRTAQGPLPNKTGSFLAREFRRAVREIELARGEILLAAGAESLELVVGALPMAGSNELAKAAQRFIKAYPAAKLRIVTGEYHKLLHDLSNSQIDMIFGILRKPEWATDVTEELFVRDNYYIVTRPGHPLAARDRVTPEDLSEYEWIAPSVGTPRRARIEAIFDTAATRPRFNLETSSLATCRALLLNSDAVTMMARSEVRHDVDCGTLTRLNCQFLNYVLRKGLTTRRDWLPTEAHTAFIDGLRDVTTAEWNRQIAPQRKSMKLVS